MIEKSRAVRKEGRGDASFGVRGAEELGHCNKKVHTPRGVFRTEKKVLVSLNGASVAASTVRGVAIMVSKETPSSGEEMVEPLGDDDTLSGVKTAEGRAMSWPVN